MPDDLPADEIRAALHRAADLAADYLEGAERYPVLPDIEPGEVAASLPLVAPEQGESLDLILDDYKALIEPRLTHWNHPGFLAYFGITGSGPGVAAETLSAALNVNAMLWRTGPAATELEERVCDWLRRMVGLPDGFHGHINDTASISSLLALAAAIDRQDDLDLRRGGLAGRPEVPRMAVYASDQAHSSIDQAALTVGLGLDQVRRVSVDEQFRMDPAALERAISEDRQLGVRPIAVVATLGTTSTTSVDPVAEIAAICRREGLWLHVDAAYAGSAAICPEFRPLFAGWEAADSIVVNPHKWMFTPIDCSVLLVRDLERWRRAFSLVPEYLRSDPGATNLMDLGVQLGRRFRALKLWFVIRAYGVEGLRERIREHCSLARDLAGWVEDDPRFELAAPVPFSTVCFRLRDREGEDAETADRRHHELLAAVNAAGPVFLSHTALDGRIVLRVAIGNIKTSAGHVEQAWSLVRSAATSPA